MRRFTLISATLLIVGSVGFALGYGAKSKRLSSQFDDGFDGIVVVNQPDPTSESGRKVTRLKQNSQLSSQSVRGTGIKGHDRTHDWLIQMDSGDKIITIFASPPELVKAEK